MAELLLLLPKLSKKDFQNPTKAFIRVSMDEVS